MVEAARRTKRAERAVGVLALVVLGGALPVVGLEIAGALNPGEVLKVNTTKVFRDAQVSDDGRAAAYHEDPFADGDIFWKNLVTSVAVNITEFGGGKAVGRLSANGRYVTYDQLAEDGPTDALLFDSSTNTREVVSEPMPGREVTDHRIFSGAEHVSDDGRYAVFVSNDPNGAFTDLHLPVGCDPSCNASNFWSSTFTQAYQRDMQTGSITLISIDRTNAGGVFGDVVVEDATPDGRHVLFVTDAPDVTSKSNGKQQVYVRDVVGGTTTLVSVDAAGNASGTGSWTGASSDEGRYAAFTTRAALASGDTNNRDDVYVRDLVTKTTTKATLASNSGQTNGDSRLVTISHEGRRVAFVSSATNIVAGDTNGLQETFIRDRVLNRNERPVAGLVASQMTSDSRYFAYLESPEENLASPTDLFVRDIRPLNAVSVGDVTVEEPDGSGNVTAHFPMTLTRLMTTTVSVAYATSVASGATATAGGDFVGRSGTASFPPGVTSVNVAVQIRPDSGVEALEWFSVLLSSPSSGLSIWDHWGKGFIVDNDPPSGVRVSVGDVTAIEGDAESTARLVVALSKPVTTPVTVRWTPGARTTTGQDASLPTTQSITFAAGEMNKTVDVALHGDTQLEPDEWLTVKLTSVSGGGVVIGRAKGTVVIRDDD